ncbi:hypothetical protein H4R33_002719 [Dimargaris cristalligena]|uniref:DUF4286 family protein n=1 Tax=Dimargaris cristalligena TaxID=215637 RepID=A0A4P9ZP45_9FUNG|nr:hypothetical protein H4R33_002719 [Dimargaris cristalligena]RKP35216.1 hypothetical protein BJ085DRAFT_29019 [Dimargaris cristalligena]|eukprot:RKP35216.1 hypothetical protein BJ085DRAFT_29019 [Dimargaris cristalligena]
MSRRTSSISLPSPGSLVYEINLSLPQELAVDYLGWLQEFTRSQVQQIDGFKDSRIFRQTSKPAGLHWLSEEAGTKEYFTVHYVVRSRQHLDDYLRNQQPALAEAEKEKYRYLVTSRRVLEVFD